VELVDYAGDRVVYGFRGLTQGALDANKTKGS
jgi:urease subunit beta